MKKRILLSLFCLALALPLAACPKEDDDSNPFAALRMIVDHNEEV